MDLESDKAEFEQLATAGEQRQDVFASLFETHSPRLRRMANLRMDPRLRARLSASDVLQDVFVEASARLDTYVDEAKMPLFLWLRFLTGQAVVAKYRHHMGAQKRDARKQVPLQAKRNPAASTIAMADALIAGGTTPTRAVAKGETREQLKSALDTMSEADREILVLRHFEELTNAEAAEELGIDISAASKRFIRALSRLRAVVKDVDFGLDLS
jgi:RNA polymerase sigma-70 factor (ECF subfamily)